MKTMKHTPICTSLAYGVFGLIFLITSVMIGRYAGQSFDNVADPVYVTADGSGEETDTSHETESTSDEKQPAGNARLIMLDAGHGGEDGGASSESGLIEKELNLAVADDVAHLCVMFGIPYKMTREDDSLLYDYYSEYTDYTGKKKSLDLKNRLRLTEESGASLFVSIHMNKFGDARYDGLQVYYSPNTPDSEMLAVSVQDFVSSHLQKSNDRAAKAATSSIYLLNHLEIPAILVECGFLSNYTEASLLATPHYRGALAATVFTPICEYFVRSAA